jgi:toxin CcdB
MAQFDLYEGSRGPLLLDCQTDFLAIDTRVVIPLLPRADVAVPVRKLNPILMFEQQEIVLMTQMMTAVRTSALGRRVASLAAEQDRIKAAIDMLFSGY